MHVAAVLVEDLGRATEGEGCIFRGGLDHHRVAQARPQALDACLEVRLVVLGDVVLGVLFKVAELARREQAFAHRAPPLRLKLLELGLERVESGGGDGFVVGHPGDASGAYEWDSTP